MRGPAAVRVAIVPFVGLVILAVISLELPSILGAVVMSIAMSGYIFIIFYRLPMVPTVEAKVLAAKRGERIGLVLLAIAVLGIIAYGASRAF